MAIENYDLIVIGGGPAGYVAAIRAAQLGFKTACIEKRKTLGGTCLNVGCIPSKAMLDSSEHYVFSKTKLSKHGVMVGDVKLDLEAMLKRKDGVVRQLVTGIAGLFKKHKIDYVNGHGTLSKVEGPNKIVTVQIDGGNRQLSAPRILLATGSEPTPLPFMPFNGNQIVSSTEALEFKSVPKHLVVVGGGVIGLELGSVWSRLGAKVTVVEFQDHILGATDRQMAGDLQKILYKQSGIEFRLSTKCLGAKPSGDLMVIELEDVTNGSKGAIECDKILVSVGRRPYTENLGLEGLGIKKDKMGRVEIDSHFQTNCPGVYAVGDIVAGPMLAHKAEDEGIAAVEIMAGQKSHVNYETIPGVVYTWPELASVGASEEDLKSKNIEFKVGVFPFMANGRAKAMDDTDGSIKILADAKTDRVLGVHVLGPRASELIAEAVAVMEYGGSAEDIARICHAHPTLPETMKEAALAVARRQIHL